MTKTEGGKRIIDELERCAKENQTTFDTKRMGSNGTNQWVFFEVTREMIEKIIEDEGVFVLSEKLKTNTTLTKMVLRCQF